MRKLLKKKKWINVLLITVMIMSMLPTSVWADGDSEMEITLASTHQSELPTEIANQLVWQSPTLQNPFGSAINYNVFLLGDGTTTDVVLQNFHESEGPGAVNGKVVGAGPNQSTQLSFRVGSGWSGEGFEPQPMAIGALISGAVEMGNTKTLRVQNGSLVYGGTKDTLIAQVEGSAYYEQNTLVAPFFSSAATDLRNMNEQIFQLSANGTVQSDGGGGHLKLIGDPDASIQIFQIDMTQLQKQLKQACYHITTENMDQADTIVINVTGDDSQAIKLLLSSTTEFHSQKDRQRHVLYNIDPKITQVTLSSGSYLMGSLYAPNADVIATEAGSSVNGHLVAKSLNGSGTVFECHWFPWDGKITEPVVPKYPDIDITKKAEPWWQGASRPDGTIAFTFQAVFEDTEPVICAEATVTMNQDDTTVSVKLDWTAEGKKLLENKLTTSDATIDLTIKEVGDLTNDKWRYDIATYTVTIGKDGIDYVITKKPETITFTNKYINDSVTIPVNKQILTINNNEREQQGSFEIQLLDSQKNVLDTIVLNKDNEWNGQFLVKRPLSGAQTYTIHEVQPEPLPLGWQYAEDLQVTVDSNKVVTVGQESVDAVVIQNIYNSTELSVTKNLINLPSGSNLSQLPFTFGLFAEGETEPIRTAAVDPQSFTDQTMKAVFTDIPAPVEINGQYTYQIKELTGDALENWQYDHTIYTITVDRDGVVSIVEPVEADEIVFTNVHKTQIPFTKKIAALGNDPKPNEFTFTFELSDRDHQVVQTMTLTQEGFNGQGMFKNIAVPTEGVDQYWLKEVAGTAQGWEYDGTEYQVTVDTTGKVSIVSTANTASETEAVFTNTYKTPVEIELYKMMKHRHNNVFAAIPAGTYQFAFDLYDHEDMVDPVGAASATIQSNGFPLEIKVPLEFALESDYGQLADGTYYIKEQLLTDNGWLPNTQVFRLIIAGNAVAECSERSVDGEYIDIDPGNAVFLNIYQTTTVTPPPVDPENPPTPPVDPENPPTPPVDPEDPPTPPVDPEDPPTPPVDPGTIDGPGPDPIEPEIEVPSIDVPLVERPTAPVVNIPAEVLLPDPVVPLAPAAPTEVEIELPAVPLSDNPKTGAPDTTRYVVAMIALIGLLIINLGGRKEA